MKATAPVLLSIMFMTKQEQQQRNIGLLVPQNFNSLVRAHGKRSYNQGDFEDLDGEEGNESDTEGVHFYC